MRYDEILIMVKATNQQLSNIGFSSKMIDEFWNECLTEAKEINKQKK